ncbi:beta strand repeat-containing protein [Luteolibacter soli]|uniref:Autotransporter-associated beta strand repeat-containing protein n=1 Tax=Luteolibacter soli TaxID=3135280 RepID=A0ABU9ARD5_9BACT
MTQRQTLLALAAMTSLSATPVLALSLYWDGTNTTPDADGGAGTWDTATTLNWDTAATAGSDAVWPATGTDNDAVFAGAGGAVTIPTNGVVANDLSFQSTGYTVSGDPLTLNAATNNITVAGGVTAAISVPVTATAGNVNVVGTGTLDLSGAYAGSARNFTVSSATVNLSSPTFAIKKFIVGAIIGTTTPATLNLNGGTVTTSGDYVGIGDGISATLNVQGGNLTLGAATTALFLGTNTNTVGTLNITSGSVNVNSGPLNVGTGYNGAQTTASTGILTISGTGAYNHNSGSQVKLTNSANQTGTVNLLAGGTFSINGQAITKGLGTATFNFDGGTLRSLVSTANYFTGGLNPVVNAGGANVDTNGFNGTISTNLTAGTGNGGLTKKGAGFLGLAGVNTYTGNTVIQGGQLIANALTAIPAPAKVSVASGAGYGTRLGLVSEADFLSLAGAAAFAPGSYAAFDTGSGNQVLTTNIATATNLGTAIGLAKVGANTLTVDLSAQTFTGDIAVNGGPLTLDTAGTRSYGGAITGNQTLNVQGTGGLTLTGTSSIGQFNKFGGSTFTSAGTMTVANGQNFYAHEGTFRQTGGVVNSGAYVVIGRTAGLTAEYVINEGVLNASGVTGTSRNTVLAEQGSTGILTINGGLVNALNSATGGAAGNSVYGIRMAGTVADTATLNLNGGTLVLSRTTGVGTSTFNFNGGTLKANNSFTDFMWGLTRANVRNGGAVIDTNGSNVTIAQALRHSEIPGDAATDGGLVKRGDGALDLASSENDYTGDTTVVGGSLVMHSPTLADGSDVTIGSGAFLDLETGVTDTIRTLVINGQPAAVGTWGGSGSSGADHVSDAILGDGLLLVTQLAAVSDYDAWATGKGLTGGNAASTADPDQDGVSNLLEFALDGDPLSASDKGKQVVQIQDVSAPAGKELTLVVAVRDGATFTAGSGNSQTATVDGVVYRIEGSLGLASFDSPVSHVSVSDDAGIDMPYLGGTDWEYHTFKLNASEGLPSKGFLRVSVQPAP